MPRSVVALVIIRVSAPPRSTRPPECAILAIGASALQPTIPGTCLGQTGWPCVEKDQSSQLLPSRGRVCSATVVGFQQIGAQVDRLGNDPAANRSQRGRGRNASAVWRLSTGWAVELRAHPADSNSCPQEVGSPSGDSRGSPPGVAVLSCRPEQAVGKMVATEDHRNSALKSLNNKIQYLDS